MLIRSRTLGTWVILKRLQRVEADRFSEELKLKIGSRAESKD
jgi:hypothetical protein